MFLYVSIANWTTTNFGRTEERCRPGVAGVMMINIQTYDPHGLKCKTYHSSHTTPTTTPTTNHNHNHNHNNNNNHHQPPPGLTQPLVILP